jgi:SagB-type dehydrogenase family enzyme
LPKPGKKSGRRIASPIISAVLSAHVRLDLRADGGVTARFADYSVNLGRFSPTISDRLQDLRTGLALSSFAGGRKSDKEIDVLVRRLARAGLLEFRLTAARSGKDQVVIEPQLPDYWPQPSKLSNTDVITVSRFAYLRRRGKEMVLESPLAGALFRICDPKIAAVLTVLSTPKRVSKLRQVPGFPGVELLALLLDCNVLFKVESTEIENLRGSEGGDVLVPWDFHDLLFHTRSTEGRQANPLGGLYPYLGRIPPPPAVRPPWPGKKIDLRNPASTSPATTPFSTLLHERLSTRDFDDERPITIAELAGLLDNAARVQSKWTSSVDMGDGGPEVSFAARPYPSGGAAYELELYLTVANCEGLERGFYHYDPDQHALTPIAVGATEIEAQLAAAEFAMGAAGTPQILITIAARFDRVSWKYSSVAYSLILKDVGVLFQTLYLMATDMKLGGCAIGTNNIELFAKMTGMKFYAEGPVGQFALGRGWKAEPADKPPF